MTQWVHTLRLLPEWELAKQGEISTHAMAKVISDRLRKLRISDESLADEREDIAYEFESFSGDDDANTDDFDSIMETLYDWADTPLDGQWNGKKLCWVKTF